jgi:methionyl aminopeptidase
MFLLGEPSVLARRLVRVTQEAMRVGIAQVKPGATLGDIGHAIQKFVESHRYSIVREYCGHGIGREFHEEPQVLHYGRPGEGLELQEGMCFTVEPMVNAGRRYIKLLPDGWTVVTKDRSLSAQWEHTVLVTADGHEILTLRQEEHDEQTPP